MEQQVTETREAVTQTPGGAVRDTTTATTATGSGYSTAARIISFITGLILALLAMRFVLSLLGAKQTNAFADLIYSVTYPLVAPFFGLFGYTMQYGVARFELETLVAMVVYALMGYGLTKLVTIGRNR